MAIYDEKRMKQKPVYPTKQTPSYADWRLFQMGKELEQSIPSGVTVDQEVIAGSTNAVAGGAVKTYVDTEVSNVNEVPVSTVEDATKVLTVDSNGEPNWAAPTGGEITVDQTVIAGSTNPVAGGAVKTYVDTEVAGVNEVPVSTIADANKILAVGSDGEPNWVTPSGGVQYSAGDGIDITNNIISCIADFKFDKQNTAQFTLDSFDFPTLTTLETLSQDYLNKDIIIFVVGVSDGLYVENDEFTNSNNVSVGVRNSSSSVNCSITYVIYTRNKNENRDNHVTVVGTIDYNYSNLPIFTSADNGKILSVDSTGSLIWIQPSTPQITVDQTVVAGSTNAVAGGAVKTYVDTEIAGVNEVPASTSADANKVLTVNLNGDASWVQPVVPQITVDQIVVSGSTNPVSGGAVKAYVDTEIAGVNEVPSSVVSDSGKILSVNSSGVAEWDSIENFTEQTVIAGNMEPVSGAGVKTYVDTAIGNVKQVPTTSVSGKILASGTNGTPEWDDIENFTEQTVIAGNLEPVSGAGVKTYVDTAIAGVNEVPVSSASDVNKVLTVDSNGNANWQTPISSGITRHTYNTFGELAADIIQHPGSVLIYKYYIRYYVDSNGVRLYGDLLSGSGSTLNITYYEYGTPINSSNTSTSLSLTTVRKIITTSITSDTPTQTLNISELALYY